MKKVLVTGSEGFVGRNLRAALSGRKDLELMGFDVSDAPSLLAERLQVADSVFHLAGVNRPISPEEFQTGNVDLTRRVVSALKEGGRKVPIVVSSSTQAALDNPYGQSKRLAEEAALEYGRSTGAPAHVYRLTNVFGKGSRPNYNSVVATFCHNIAHDLEIQIADPSRELELVYVDDVVAEFVAVLDGAQPRARLSGGLLSVGPTHKITLGRLAESLRGFRAAQDRGEVPAFSDPLSKHLYATYRSFTNEATR
jgi:UDP-2-acetamido-2,6-beta-L-arabino-hexul-4-ose reductase